MFNSGARRLMGLPSGRYDGHAHVFHKSLPMIVPRRYSPKEDAYLEGYIELLKQHHLDGAVLVQPSFLGTDNSYLLDTLEHAEGSTDLAFRGVVAVEPDTPISQLSEMKSKGVVGMRLNLIEQPTPDFQDRNWLGLFDDVNALGWHVEVHIEGARLSGILPYLLRLCETVVIDHFGRPDSAAPLECPGFRSILEAADQQLLVKTSAPFRVFPHTGSSEAAAKSLLIYRQLQAALGPEKLVWGSDWPWTMFEDRHDFAQTLNWLYLASPLPPGETELFG